MSHTIVSQCTARLNRTEQAVPGSNQGSMEKAAKGDAAVVFLDLEDAGLALLTDQLEDLTDPEVPEISAQRNRHA